MVGNLKTTCRICLRTMVGNLKKNFSICPKTMRGDNLKRHMKQHVGDVEVFKKRKSSEGEMSAKLEIGN